MKTEEYSLRDNSINFEVEVADSSNLYALSQEHLIALANYGLSSWAWRAGAKKSSDGKVFSVADVAKDLATIKSKDGEPLPADKELATAQLAKWKKASEALEIPDDLTGPDAKDWQVEQAAEMGAEWCEAQAQKHGFEAPDFDPETFASFMRLRRLAIARNVAKAAKAGLSDLD